MTPPDNMQPFRIATFNVENLDDPRNKEPKLKDRIRVLRPQLLRTRADVLCLQEVDGQPDGDGKRNLKALDKLIDGTPYADFERVFTVSRSKGGARDKHNLVILSRFPIIGQNQIHHDLVAPVSYRQITAAPHPESAGEIDWDRPILHAALDLGAGNVLNVINLHLRAPRAAFIEGQKEDKRTWRTVPGWAEGFFLAAVKRAGQALEVRMFVDSLFDADEGSLIAVAGDFNADDFETPVRTIRGDENDISNAKLAGRMLVALERSIAETQRFSVIHNGRARMLDHLLASPALLGHYRKSEIHNEGLGDELSSPAVHKGSPESYHAPLVAEFALK